MIICGPVVNYVWKRNSLLTCLIHLRSYVCLVKCVCEQQSKNSQVNYNKGRVAAGFHCLKCNCLDNFLEQSA